MTDVFEYRDGELYWLTGRRKGQRFGSPHSNGYRRGAWRGRFWYEHRLIWEMFKGPTGLYIDHIDGDKQNNKIENLREASHSQNLANSKIYKNNKSGHKGVFYDKERQCYRVEVKFAGKSITHRVDDFELACLVADEARNLLHGQYAKS